MRTTLRRSVFLSATCASLALFAACSHFQGGPMDEFAGVDGCPPGTAGDCPGCDPKVCKDPTVMNLARDLDHLERHVDWFGSVVAKVPDVWGQARLTQHR